MTHTQNPQILKDTSKDTSGISEPRVFWILKKAKNIHNVRIYDD